MKRKSLPGIGVDELKFDLAHFAQSQQWKLGIIDIRDQMFVLPEKELQLQTVIRRFDRDRPNGNVYLRLGREVEILGAGAISVANEVRTNQCSGL